MEDFAFVDGLWVGRGATVTADYRAAARAAVTWGRPGQFAIGGFEIQHLPEPSVGETSRLSRSQVQLGQRETMRLQLQRVLQAIYTPAYFRGHGVFDISGNFPFFDLRFTNLDPHLDRPGSRVRCYLLVKVNLPSASTSDGRCPETRARAVSELESILRRIAAVFPKDVELRRLVLVDQAAEAEKDSPVGQLLVLPERLGLRGCTIAAAAEVRRKQINENLGEGISHQDFLRLPLVAGGVAIPMPWPNGGVDLLPTSAALSAVPIPLMLSLRLSPTELTVLERKALADRREGTRQGMSATLAESLQKQIARFETTQEWFQCSAQILAFQKTAPLEESKRAVEELAVTFIGEHAGSQSAARALARVRAIDPRELGVARYNLAEMQMLPWGAVDQNAVHQRRWIDGAAPEQLPEWGVPPPNDAQLKDPDEFLQRDWNQDGRLLRLRALFSLEETAAIFQLPVVPAGGQAGLVSRIKNPYEQLPARTERARDIVTFGKVQHRFLKEPLDFAMPLKDPIGHVSGILDRVSIVAGSPGSGKTNFCLSFLRQLYHETGDGPRHPFLVIDPTRGNEFRALRQWIPNKLVVFTVGDERCVGFCFNPFLVPQNVSVQAHISRLMSCFKAAYNMWDPLPAIFEMALRLCYQAIRGAWWEAQPRARGRLWLPSFDFPESSDEPFPVLDDLVSAMGKGEKTESFRGFPTVMQEQRKMWGEGTENSATIVASTFLRLNNLRENYSHILGGATAERGCIDLEKLLREPVVLELGMVGDSQALSLVMGFLIVSLAGIIERPPTETDPKKHRLLVIEEAHRLLSGEGGGGGKDGGNSKAQAAEDINNMLAEVRKYGLGVMLLDQRPASLVGGVIDNAYVVAMHRLNEEKSFAQFSKVLNLSADQQRFARTELRPGELISLDRRSGLPVLMRSEDLDTSAAKLPDKKLREEMLPRVAPLYFPSTAPAGEAAPVANGASATTPLLQAMLEFEDGLLVKSVEKARAAYDAFCHSSRRLEEFDVLMGALGSLRRKLAEHKLHGDLTLPQQTEALLREFLSSKPQIAALAETLLVQWKARR